MLTNEQFCPTRFICRNVSRRTIAEHCLMLWRQHGIESVHKFRSYALYIGFWPVSFRREDGTRYLSQND